MKFVKIKNKMTHYKKGVYFIDTFKISQPLKSSDKPAFIDLTVMSSSETDRVYFRQKFESWSYDKQIKFVQKNVNLNLIQILLLN